MGRFINADAFTSTGQGLLGNNMFAYSVNNPANLKDSTGVIPSGITNPNAMRYGGGGRKGGVFPDKKRMEKQAHKPFNSDEQAVLNADDYAFYKGALIVKVPGDTGFSFGVIFLGRDAEDYNIVRHEYGHFIHLFCIGLSNYTTKVAIPSLIDYWTDVPYPKYYSEPQEYIADLLGGTERTYEGLPYPYTISNTEAIMYFLYTILP